jgi:hypothetical protein
MMTGGSSLNASFTIALVYVISSIISNVTGASTSLPLTLYCSSRTLARMSGWSARSSNVLTMAEDMASWEAKRKERTTMAISWSENSRTRTFRSSSFEISAPIRASI